MLRLDLLLLCVPSFLGSSEATCGFVNIYLLHRKMTTLLKMTLQFFKTAYTICSSNQVDTVQLARARAQGCNEGSPLRNIGSCRVGFAADHHLSLIHI